MAKRLFYLTFGSSILFLVLGTAAQVEKGGSPAPPPVRKIPGITIEDMFPRGCVDCHVNRPDMNMDVRVSTLMKQWNEKVDSKFLARVQAFVPEGFTLRGKHPMVAASLEDIPAGCLKCHTKTSKLAPPFSPMLHGIHLLGGEENHFLTLFQGECTHCHKLKQGTAEWSMPSGPEK